MVNALLYRVILTFSKYCKPSVDTKICCLQLKEVMELTDAQIDTVSNDVDKTFQASICR